MMNLNYEFYKLFIILDRYILNSFPFIRNAIYLFGKMIIGLRIFFKKYSRHSRHGIDHSRQKNKAELPNSAEYICRLLFEASPVICFFRDLCNLAQIRDLHLHIYLSEGKGKGIVKSWYQQIP